MKKLRKKQLRVIPELPLYMTSQQRGDALTQLVVMLGDIPAASFIKASEAYSKEAGKFISPAAVKIGAVVSLVALGMGLPGDETRQQYLLALEEYARARLQEFKQEQGNGTPE